MIEHRQDSVILSSQRFRIQLSTAPGTTRLLEEFSISSRGDGRFDIHTGLGVWTGFAGVTSHTREFFLTTESPQGPSVHVIEDTDTRSCIRYGPLRVASWTVFWTLTLEAEELGWQVWVHVGRRTVPDDEINLLAFDVPPDDEFVEARFDTGYIMPPKAWFAIPAPEVTYAGNVGARGILDRRVRLRFAGDGHDTLFLSFASGYGLSLSCAQDNCFRLVPRVVYKPSAPRDPRRLPPARFEFKSHERFAIGTALRQEACEIPPQTQFHCAVTIRAFQPEPVETMRLDTPDPAIAERTKRYHRTHAHGSIAHKWGFAGGWHNTGLPDGHSVSFEYFMHGKAHLYGLHPAIDGLMARALDSVHDRETHPDGLIWQHGFAGRGEFYENNASMLIFLADYVRRTGDLSRLAYGDRWAGYILAHITEEPFLFRCPASTGIPGQGTGARICNWWDVVSCGGYDAFINALTYPGLRDMAAMHRAAGNLQAAERYRRAAERLRAAFNELFWDEAAGRYISWVDTAGGRHDYFFTSVNLIAAAEGIADGQRRRRILESIRARLDEIGYRGFSLPCNLINIPPESYNAGDWWIETYGYPHFYDTFGTYENGGIFPWISAYYIAAAAEFDPDAAYDHFAAILDQYERDNLQGAGNGYFWDPETGQLTEGSKQEPYLANTAMTIWGFLSLFGIEFDIERGIVLRPRLPQRLDGARVGVRYHGKCLEFRFQGFGRKVLAVRVDRASHPPEAPLVASQLRDGGVVEVTVGA